MTCNVEGYLERTKQRKMGVWIGLIRLRIETSDGLWKHGSEKSVPIKAYIFLTNILLPYQQEMFIRVIRLNHHVFGYLKMEFTLCR
jgi:hypothetical protein